MQMNKTHLAKCALLTIACVSGCDSVTGRPVRDQESPVHFKACPLVFINVIPGGLLVAVWSDARLLRSSSKLDSAEATDFYEVGDLTSEQMARVRELLAALPESTFKGSVVYDRTYDELVIPGQGSSKVAYSVHDYHEKRLVRAFRDELLSLKLTNARTVYRTWRDLFPLEHCRQ